MINPCDSCTASCIPDTRGRLSFHCIKYARIRVFSEKTFIFSKVAESEVENELTDMLRGQLERVIFQPKFLGKVSTFI